MSKQVKMSVLGCARAAHVYEFALAYICVRYTQAVYLCVDVDIGNAENECLPVCIVQNCVQFAYFTIMWIQ